MKKKESGFTLSEVAFSLAIVGLTSGAILYGYLANADKARWSAYSLSAQSLALEGVEQVRAAQWNPQAWPAVDELGDTNFIQVEQLDAPGKNGQQVLATNYISVVTVSTNPPLKQLRTDCVWMMPGRGAKNYGPFTNTVISMRATDQ